MVRVRDLILETFHLFVKEAAEMSIRTPVIEGHSHHEEIPQMETVLMFNGLGEDRLKVPAVPRIFSSNKLSNRLSSLNSGKRLSSRFLHNPYSYSLFQNCAHSHWFRGVGED